MAEGLTPLDLAKLAYPFRRDDHDFLQGYVYIQEEAITERLDTVDPNWSLTVEEAVAYGDSIVCFSTLTVKGVKRSNAGGNPVQREKNDSTQLGKYAIADNGVNAYKAAATDALKRCARMFGIGRYLLSAPKTSKDDTRKFDEWLIAEQTAAKARHDALRTVDTATGEIMPKDGVEAPPQPGTPQQPQQAKPESPDPRSGAQNGAPASAPKADTGASSSGGQTGTSQPSGDDFAKQFPASVKWTRDMLHDATHDYFNGREHFDAHWNKHEAEYGGLTLEETAALVRALHWNYDKERATALVNWAKAELGMTVQHVMQALTDASPHSVKKLREWDSGTYADAQEACRVWARHEAAKDLEREEVQ